LSRKKYYFIERWKGYKRA